MKKGILMILGILSVLYGIFVLEVAQEPSGRGPGIKRKTINVSDLFFFC